MGQLAFKAGFTGPAFSGIEAFLPCSGRFPLLSDALIPGWGIRGNQGNQGQIPINFNFTPLLDEVEVRQMHGNTKLSPNVCNWIPIYAVQTSSIA